MRRSVALALICMFGFLAVGGMVAPLLTPARADVCDSAAPDLPGPIDPKGACKGAKAVGGAVTDPAGTARDAAGDAAESVSEPIFEQLTQWVADGAAWLIKKIGNLIDETTTPRIKSGWFGEQYDIMTLLAVTACMPLLCMAVIEAALRKNAALLTRAFAAIPTAFILSAMAIAVVALLLSATDWACNVVADAAGQNSKDFFRDVSDAFAEITVAGGGNQAPALFISFIVSIFAALAGFAVWVELLIRSAAIYVCVLFVPVVLAARVWPRLEGWARRLAEVLIAVILSKFVIVAILSLSASGLANSGAGQGFNGALAGTALLMLACFSPIVLFNIVSFAQTDFHRRGGSGSTAVRMAPQTMTAAQSMKSSLDRIGKPTALAGSRGLGATGGAAAAASRAGGGTGLVAGVGLGAQAAKAGKAFGAHASRSPGAGAGAAASGRPTQAAGATTRPASASGGGVAGNGGAARGGAGTTSTQRTLPQRPRPNPNPGRSLRDQRRPPPGGGSGA